MEPRRIKQLVRLVCSLTTAAFSLLAAYGCMLDQDEPYIFGAVYMTMSAPYYETLHDELSAAIEQHGDRLLARNSESSAERQAEQIRSLIDRDVDGLFVNALNVPVVDAAIAEARAQGIPVIAFNSPRSSLAAVDCTVVSDNLALGAMCARNLCARDTGGRILVLSQQDLASMEQRAQGFAGVIDAEPGFEIVQTLCCANSREAARDQTLAVIDSGLSFDTVFAVSDDMAIGALSALTERGLAPDVRTYGVNGSTDARLLISEGLMTATAAQFPRAIAGNAASCMYDLIHGLPVDPLVEISGALIHAGNLTQFQIDDWG